MNDLGDYEVVRLPVDLTAGDQKRHDVLANKLFNLQREFQERSEPLIKAIADIDAMYEPRFALMPKRPAKETP